MQRDLRELLLAKQRIGRVADLSQAEQRQAPRHQRDDRVEHEGVRRRLHGCRGAIGACLRDK